MPSAPVTRPLQPGVVHARGLPSPGSPALPQPLHSLVTGRAAWSRGAQSWGRRRETPAPCLCPVQGPPHPGLSLPLPPASRPLTWARGEEAGCGGCLSDGSVHPRSRGVLVEGDPGASQHPPQPVLFRGTAPITRYPHTAHACGEGSPGPGSPPAGRGLASRPGQAPGCPEPHFPGGEGRCPGTQGQGDTLNGSFQSKPLRTSPEPGVSPGGGQARLLLGQRWGEAPREH